MTELGIHTSINGDDAEAAFKSHAWITIGPKDGIKRNFALSDMSDDVKAIGQERGWDGSGKTQVREGLDTGKGTANLWKDMTPAEEKRFWATLEKPQQHAGNNNNCAHWACNMWKETFGTRLSAEHTAEYKGRMFTRQTPVGLEKTIQERPLEKSERRELNPHSPDQRRGSVERVAAVVKKERPPIKSFREAHPEIGKDRDR